MLGSSGVNHWPSFSTRGKGGEGCVAGRVMVSFLSPMRRGERASACEADAFDWHAVRSLHLHSPSDSKPGVQK